MAGWRAADQEPVASRAAIARGMEALVGAIENLAADGDRPVVTACWQDAAYLDVPTGLLDQLAATCTLVVACAGRADLPDGAEGVELEPDDPLTSEWSLVATSPRGGAALVANEVAATLPAPTVEGGRAFRYDVTDDPRVVVAHARRLQRTFGARMQPHVAARFAAATTAVDATVGQRDHLDRLTAHVGTAISTADDARREEADAVHGTGGLAGLAAWLGDAGPRAPSLGMIVVRSGEPGLTGALRRHAREIGRVGDIIVDVPPDAAMLVAPGLDDGALADRADDVRALLAEVLSTADVDALAVDVPAEHARHDLVGNLGTALAQLHQRAATATR